MGQDFIVFGAKVPPLYLFWGIGILLMTVYYILFAPKFKLKYWQGAILSLSFLLIETVGAILLANVEAFDQVLKDGFKIAFSMFGIMFSLPLGNLLLSKIFKMKYGDVMDYCAPGILIELVLYRVGCTFAGCCHGIPCPWFGIKYPTHGFPLFPSQPIEAFFDALLCALLIYMLLKKTYPRGTLYSLFLIGYSGIRFIVEFTRERDVLFLGMSRSHLFCLLWLAVGLYFFFLLREKSNIRKERRERHKH